MESDFQKMINKAIEIKKRYNKIELKEWNLEQDFMGMAKDMGDLSKLLMIYKGYRAKENSNLKKEIEHELADILWSVIVIAEKTGVNLEESFWDAMDELDKKLR